MKTLHYIIVLAVVAVLNVLAYVWPLRYDMTEDKRYSLSSPTQSLLKQTDEPIGVLLLLGGELNPSFLQLKSATERLVEEMNDYADIRLETLSDDMYDELSQSGLKPTVIHEKQVGGQTIQTTIYPYAVLRYKGQEKVLHLLSNTRGLSGEENINRSIEQLEYTFAEGLSQLSRSGVRKIAFLEGHGELPEPYVYDVSSTLSEYFPIDRGTMTGDYRLLCDYDALVIADPQTAFSEADKYQLDQYVMQGGRILWVLDGVMLSDETLAQSGFTPVITKELNIQDILFRYGVRITPSLLQDWQCQTIPVEVSGDNENPNFQPMPWHFAPYLLPSPASPVTRNLGQVSSMFCSGLEFVGGEDGLKKDILLTTSSASKAIGVPAEVDLSLGEQDAEQFKHQYIPVAAAVEGSFPSLFSHRMIPDGVVAGPKLTNSLPTRQVVVASGSIIRNEIQQGQPLPLGYDRYSGMTFANRDFIVNAVLYLADDLNIISLRNRHVTLRLLNDKRAHDMRTQAQIITILVPLLLLALVGGIFIVIRKRKYAR